MYNDFNNMYQPGYRQMQSMNNYQMNNMQPRQSNLDWIMVQNVDEIDQIVVQPGQKAWIMVQNEPIFALRTANNMGLVSTETYKFEKYVKEGTKMQSDIYVTRDEMNNAIRDAIKEFKYESINDVNE